MPLKKIADPFAKERAAYHANKDKNKESDMAERLVALQKILQASGLHADEIARVKKEIEDNLEIPEVDYEKIEKWVLNAFLEYSRNLPPPEKGDKGDKGDSIVGPRGPKGDTVVGPPGPEGRPGRDAVIDLKEITRAVIQNLPKEDTVTMQQLQEYVHDVISRSGARVVRVGGSVASIRALTDVDLTGVPMDSNGNYLLGSGSGSSLPDQTGNSGKFLTTDGTDASWASLAGGGDMAAAVYDPQAIGSDAFDQDNMTDGTTNKNYTATEQTKLAGIETGADVTDTTNVTAAGALMDSEVTNLAAVKAFDPTDYATAAQGALADSAVQPGDNVSDLTNDAGYLTSYTETDPVVGAITGIVKANGAGTISAAVADTDYLIPGTAASTYQPLDSDLTTIAAANNGSVLAATTASFTTADETKLDGIEALADVTDTTNVTAAGALMDSELTDITAVKALADAAASDVNTGTSTTMFVTPDALAGSELGKRTVSILVSGSASGDSALATGDGLAAFPIDTTLNGMNLVAVKAYVTTVSSSGAPLFQVRRSRRSSATARTVVDMLTTGVSIDANEFESADATTAVLINGTNDDVQTGDILLIDCDTAGTGTKGAQVLLTFQLP